MKNSSDWDGRRGKRLRNVELVHPRKVEVVHPGIDEIVHLRNDEVPPPTAEDTSVTANLVTRT